ncbi:MAG: hypothetical protein ACJZ57_10430 [Candidatus Poriferisodalaceae bacterium]|nr:MAG: hypothetical protein CNE88_09330 [Acidimicrobiales bacterium MED-G01]
MTPLAFLGLAAAITLVGSLFLLIGSRKRTPWDSSINAFQKRLDALAPEENRVVELLDDEPSPGSGRHSAGT